LETLDIDYYSEPSLEATTILREMYGQYIIILTLKHCISIDFNEAIKGTF